MSGVMEKVLGGLVVLFSRAEIRRLARRMEYPWPVRLSGQCCVYKSRESSARARRLEYNFLFFSDCKGVDLA